MIKVQLVLQDGGLYAVCGVYDVRGTFHNRDIA